MDGELFGSARFAWKEMAGGICFWISGTQTHYGPFFFGWRFRYVMRLCRYDAIFYSLHSIHNASRLYLVFALFTLVPAILSPKHVPTFPRLYFVFFFSLLFVCCQTRPVYYSIFHQKFYAHHFFFHSVHSHSPNANSSRGCFSTWLLTSISMEVMGVHKKERDSSEHEQDKATVMLLLVLLPLYIYIRLMHKTEFMMTSLL